MYNGTVRSVVAVAVVLSVSCSKPAEVKCGEGTELKDGVCVVRKSEPPKPEPTASVTPEGSGSASVDSWNKPAEPPAPPPGPRWRFSESRDDMRQKEVHYASIKSTNAADFDFPYNGGARLEIVLRKGDPGSGFGLDVLAIIEKGQFECSSYRGCTATVKFDDGKVETW